MRTRAERRHYTEAKMWRRLKEDRNQHRINDDWNRSVGWPVCACWTNGRAMARFKEQPQHCSCLGCGNPRRHKISLKERLTIQERRAMEADKAA